ncbi:hypothetical protein AK812_SmicGene26242 [Symbiodinium microadriaticum]|uniref:Uncharacterized protein n=1 Tax=Symbiodinium microadriaticum TaxID=2951 RepID=A0A1Q9DA36_SYMMI|nr:hypothetical protein AK812_SmicGene26242 [Symbiodinium microadriaticum]
MIAKGRYCGCKARCEGAEQREKLLITADVMAVSELGQAAPVNKDELLRWEEKGVHVATFKGKMQGFEGTRGLALGCYEDAASAWFAHISLQSVLLYDADQKEPEGPSLSAALEEARARPFKLENARPWDDKGQVGVPLVHSNSKKDSEKAAASSKKNRKSTWKQLEEEEGLLPQKFQFRIWGLETTRPQAFSIQVMMYKASEKECGQALLKEFWESWVFYAKRFAGYRLRVGSCPGEGYTVVTKKMNMKVPVVGFTVRVQMYKKDFHHVGKVFFKLGLHAKGASQPSLSFQPAQRDMA